MVQPKFELVQEDTEPPAPRVDNDVAARMLTLALGALSQRALVALASLFSIVLAGSCFILFYITLPNPSVFQLVGLGMYALFILALHVIRYRGVK